MSALDPLIGASADYAETFPVDLPPPPARKIAILTCMDARLHPEKFLGLVEGDAHVLRNAGGVITEDVLRSLAMSQRLLGTRAVAVIQHTNCGMASLQDAEFRDDIEAETGRRPSWPAPDFAPDLQVSVTGALEVLRSTLFLPYRDDIRGFVFDVSTGRLGEVGG